jgi:hypothetical protein
VSFVLIAKTSPDRVSFALTPERKARLHGSQG